MYFSSDERKWINRILRFADEHPGDVTILAMPDDNDGAIYAAIPAAWLYIRPPMHRNISDEQRAELVNRMRDLRKQKAGSDAPSQTT